MSPRTRTASTGFALYRSSSTCFDPVTLHDVREELATRTANRDSRREQGPVHKWSQRAAERVQAGLTPPSTISPIHGGCTPPQPIRKKGLPEILEALFSCRDPAHIQRQGSQTVLVRIGAVSDTTVVGAVLLN